MLKLTGLGKKKKKKIEKESTTCIRRWLVNSVFFPKIECKKKKGCKL